MLRFQNPGAGFERSRDSWFCLPSNRGRDFVPWHDGPTPFTMKALSPAGGVAVNSGLSGAKEKGGSREGLVRAASGLPGSAGRGARGGPGRIPAWQPFPRVVRRRFNPRLARVSGRKGGDTDEPSRNGCGRRGPATSSKQGWGASWRCSRTRR